MPGPLSCTREGCSKEWPRDPILEVPCPTCKAKVGRRCVRPSGHGGNFVDFRDQRDLAALAAGHYGICPLRRCCDTIEDYLARQAAKPQQLERGLCLLQLPLF